MKLQEWLEAQEEFGDEVFKRFFVQLGVDSYFPESNEFALIDIDSLDLLQFHHLAQHDAEFYGPDQYFKMWQWRYADGTNDWQDCDKSLSFNPDKEYRRKNSAALPFDLERAKAGDIFEFHDNGTWCNALISDFSDKEGLTIFISSRSCYVDNPPYQYLHMKYPPRIKK